MINVSNTIKTDCESNKITYREYIIITGTQTQIDIQGEMYQTAYKDTHFVGTFNLGYVKFKTENNVTYINKEFDYYKEVNGNAILIGHYIVTEVTDNDTEEEVSVTAFDNGLKFATPYVSGLDYASNEVTLFDVLEECCQNCGVELVNESITNGDFIVENNQFLNDETYGDVICAIAQTSGDFATITNEGKLQLLFYTNTNEIIEDYVELEDKRDTHPITCLRIGTSQVEGQGAEIKDDELIEQYGENWLVINDNPFTYTLEKREQIKTAIFNKVKGFGYSAFTSKYSFKPYLTLGDKIQFRNKSGELVNSIILRIETKFDDITLSAPSIINATIEYQNPNTAYDIAKRAEVIADQNTAQITIITNKTSQLEDNMNNNYYQKDAINQIIVNTETGVTNTFSEAGGNNILRNTGLWFQASKDKSRYLYPKNDLYPSSDLYMIQDASYEFWNGYAKKIINDKAVNSTSIILQNGIFSQEQNVPNGFYSVSFYYRKLNVFATASVKINDVEYPLESMEYEQFYSGKKDENGEYIVPPIEVTSRHFKIEFLCDMEDGLEIYDLMVNKGSVKLAYSQNENEVTTDTVNISKGITITSSNMETKFKADADGIRITKLNNETVSYFTEKGLETKEAIIEEEANICKTIIIDVGDQTWFTRI